MALARQATVRPLVFLFSGHMIDAPNRPRPRFPASKEPVARQAIENKLDELEARAGDIGISGGACGGDLLFAEACLRRAMQLQIFLSHREPDFLRYSVQIGPQAEQWRDRFLAVKQRASVFHEPQEFVTAGSTDPYEQLNLQLLQAALAHGAERLRFLCLWNGEPGDGRGGTQHMIEAVRNRGAPVHILDSRILFSLP